MKDAAGNEAVEVTRTVEVQAKMSLDPFGKAEVKPYVPVTLYGRVRVGEVAASEGDVVAVWVGEEMRGKVQIQFVVGDVAYLTLPIYAEQEGEKTNRFKLWDQSSDEVHELGKVMELSIGGTIGSAEELVELDFGVEGDKVAPVIELLGEEKVVVELGADYEDAGAKATDSVDGTLTVISVSTVNTDAVGIYTVTYSVKDAAGNEAVEVTRTVEVVDTTKPVIELLGNASETVEAKGTYSDAGAKATDSVDGTLTVISVSTVNTDAVGIYTVTYSVKDAAGNEAVEVTRTVEVVDTTKPVIELLGNASETVEVGSGYEDAGAMATDGVDGDLSRSIVVQSHVDTARPGIYRVSYNVQDSAGNVAVEVVRVVEVKPRLVETLSLDVVQRQPFTFKFMAQIGRIYEVEVSGDLQKWIKVKEINGTDGTVKFADDRNINESVQFYRLRMR